MLSRVAENIYWLGRYLERIENSARLINVTRTMLLDLPQDKEHPNFGWRSLLTITGSSAISEKIGVATDETSILLFLLQQEENPSSLFSAITAARENLRTMRDIFPREFWEGLNRLYLFIREHAETGRVPKDLDGFLRDVVHHCQGLVGLLVGTLSRGTAFDFFRIGQYLERADMNTRILDVRASALASYGNLPQSHSPFENLQWLNLLRSISGEQMYRRHANPRTTDIDVLTFLLRNQEFPRAFAYCLYKIKSCLRTFAHHGSALLYVERLEQRLAEADLPELLHHGLGQFMDDLQRELGTLHHEIAVTYFGESDA